MISPSNLGCKEVADLLDDYRRNRVEPHVRVLVSEHLEQCENCTEELRLREALRAQLASALPGSTARPGLSPAVQRALATTQTGQNEPRRSSLLPWMLSAALVLVAAVAMLQIRPPRTPLPASAEIAALSKQEQAAPAQRRLGVTRMTTQRDTSLDAAETAPAAPAAAPGSAERNTAPTAAAQPAILMEAAPPPEAKSQPAPPEPAEQMFMRPEAASSRAAQSARRDAGTSPSAYLLAADTPSTPTAVTDALTTPSQSTTMTPQQPAPPTQ